jgi:hypothetical protein
MTQLTFSEGKEREVLKRNDNRSPGIAEKVVS